MTTRLVIVESPAKARTIAGFLANGFLVESSIGHIRDLPRNASEVPAQFKDQPWARLGVDVDNDFKPLYVVSKEKRDQVKKLKHVLAGADELYLATDEDREGESIAWHLREVLEPTIPVKRMVFHEITRHAIQTAIENPRDLDMNLIDAQEARRILDRLYGYEVSPVLWRKIRPKLSAGRVQSVAVRLLVQRERERIGFVSASYWDLEASFVKEGSAFTADLWSVAERRVATGKDFSPEGSTHALVLDEAQARSLAADLEDTEFVVDSVDRKPYRRSPYPPFRTSTLQQEAARKFRFAAARTMATAQRLYEGGYITYMRTDSTSLSEAAVAEIRRLIEENFGSRFLTEGPRHYRRQVRNAQEAHEAIRPAGDRFLAPSTVASRVSADEARLYDLIWRRTVASQMSDAIGESMQVRVRGIGTSGMPVVFAASGRTIAFPGFLDVYVVDRDDQEAERDDQERPLPALEPADVVETAGIEPRGHETKAPTRFTEASLVRKLEQLGIGRPSTYASIISTIQDRGYVWKRASALIPTFLAFATVGLLEEHFPDLVDYGFTARMEDDLDQIAKGENDPLPWLTGFYFGNGTPGLREMVSDRLAEIDAREVNSIPIGIDEQSRAVVARVGRYGPYLQRGEDTAPLPDHLAPDELTLELATEMLDAPSGDKILGTDPHSGLTVLARVGRFGPYVQLGGAEELEGEKPKTASMPAGDSIDAMSLDRALELLSLPRVVGVDPESGKEITAQRGRYGPYLKRGSESRSLPSEDQIFTVTLEEALALFEQPQVGRRWRQTAALRELGVHPETGKPVTIREGRYGPYVTDGQVNASLRKGDDPDTIVLERALELLAAKRAKAT
ncbi:MAG TPA: type I DNA topoisomerase [Acidimicrobiia bacterium]